MRQRTQRVSAPGRRRRRGSSGTTLVELLVSILMVSILNGYGSGNCGAVF